MKHYSRFLIVAMSLTACDFGTEGNSGEIVSPTPLYQRQELQLKLRQSCQVDSDCQSGPLKLVEPGVCNPVIHLLNAYAVENETLIQEIQKEFESQAQLIKEYREAQESRGGIVCPMVLPYEPFSLCDVFQCEAACVENTCVAEAEGVIRETFDRSVFQLSVKENNPTFHRIRMSVGRGAVSISRSQTFCTDRITLNEDEIIKFRTALDQLAICENRPQNPSEVSGHSDLLPTLALFHVWEDSSTADIALSESTSQALYVCSDPTELVRLIKEAGEKSNCSSGIAEAFEAAFPEINF